MREKFFRRDSQGATPSHTQPITHASRTGLMDDGHLREVTHALLAFERARFVTAQEVIGCGEGGW
jgi:hypothetical protein